MLQEIVTIPHRKCRGKDLKYMDAHCDIPFKKSIISIYIFTYFQIEFTLKQIIDFYF